MSAHLISTTEASSLIEAHMPAYKIVTVPLHEASGRILRSPLLADRDLPPFDRVTMDGVAIDYGAWQAGVRSFRVEGIAAAGHPQRSLADCKGACIQVMTGAMLPAQCDTIIPFEDVELQDDHAHIKPSSTVTPLTFLHSQGSDRRAGEVIVAAGQRLQGTHCAIAAAVGSAQIDVSYVPTIALVSTGDELKRVEDTVEPYQIRSANDFGMAASLRNEGFNDITCAYLADDLEQSVAQLGPLLESHDVLILTGGVSMGKRDFIPAALEELNVMCHFHKIRQKPGKPMWFGTSASGKPIFALPGNTVSSLVCLHRYVLPALLHAMQALSPKPQYAVLSEAYRFTPPLAGFLPVKIESQSDGRLLAHPVPTNTSGDYAALSSSDGFVELPEGSDIFLMNDVLRFYSWS